MFSPITAADNIKDEFIGYISTLFHISDKDYAAQFAAALREEGAIAKGPYLDVSDSYKTGKSLAQMIEEGEASSLFHSLEGDIPDGEKEIQINRGLYLHQERALRKTNKGKNLIVTTGTGSGKTECFIIPIINHLLREAEEGTLSSGVRAILIYPMNALANDQMKRLRNLLKSYPEITFGVYNSSTKQNEQDGIAEYGKVYKDANGRPLKPLKNEIVSRDQMQKTPPHILVTNYAMLEYMMLRPKDDLVFSRAKLRFLVLDEAHIYRGATGMETSLLLKRLKARISNPANVLHILTSATLGGKEADDDIVKFAETLCNASFYAEDIIRSQSVVPSYDREPVDVPLSMFAELIDPQKPLNVIADDYGLPIPDGIPDAEYLYDLCVSASVYRDLRRITSHPMTIPEITRALRATHNVTRQDVVNIIGVAAQASKNKSALIKARYHMFAKALEGAYVTLGQNKKLMLNRNRSITIGDENWKVFECAICDDCGRVAVAGKEVDGKLEFANSSYAKLSSHDFTYFKNPENMITGKIGVPLFTVRNEKIILRHIFAVALSDFFAKQVDVYNSNNADVLLSGDGWERFCAYLSSKPEHLKDVLKASIPESMHRVMGINDFSWTEKLVGKDGVLKVAVDEFRGTVQYYIDEYRRLLAEGLTQQAAAVEKKLWSYRRGKEDNRGRNELIEFLVRNNVLPKYGFPVDTVELYQNTNAATDKKLQMVRDLQLAISEYAPDSQVVADGKLYTSRYIRKLPQTTGQDWETAYIAQCNNPSCMTWNHRLMEPDEGGEPCVSCHEIISKSRWKQAIEPRKGFVADAKPKDVPMRKPDKAFRSDDFYIGDAQRQVMQKYAFVMKDGNRFQMETSINDSLMVVCNDDFYVCPHCGYAESTMENMEVAGFNSHQKTLEKKHITPWGKNCEVKLVKNKLCHVFKTDVVRLVFSTPQAGNQEVMLSVMYALLEALSSVMDIERNDIKGCLHKIVYDNKLIYAIVLYDAVAGGAGHVRRLVTEDGRCFRQVVEKAIAITKGCNCSPSCYSCLRNYYNQKIHDLLNRKYAYDFLENYYGELEPITNEEFENGELYNV